MKVRTDTVVDLAKGLQRMRIPDDSPVGYITLTFMEDQYTLSKNEWNELLDLADLGLRMRPHIVDN